MTGSLDDPQGLNRYIYCRNNPHKYTDPDGQIVVTPRKLLGYGLVVTWSGLWEEWLYLQEYPGDYVGGHIRYKLGYMKSLIYYGILEVSGEFPMNLPYLPAAEIVSSSFVTCVEEYWYDLGYPGIHERPTYTLTQAEWEIVKNYLSRFYLEV